MKTSNFSPVGGATEPKLPLPLENRLARLFRALTPYSQAEFGERTGIHPTTLARYETGDEKPTLAHLESMARVADLPIEEAKDYLHRYDSRGQTRLRAGYGAEPWLAKVGEELRVRLENAYQSFLRLANPEETQRLLDGQMAVLRILDEPTRSSVVKARMDFQTAALAERVAAEAAARQSAGDAAGWERLAKEIAHLAESRAL